MLRGVPGGLAFAAEFVVVVSVAFGYFILASVLSLLSPETPKIGEADLQVLIFIELMATLMLAFLLHLRGWRISDLGLTPTWEDVTQGWKVVGITFLAYLAAATALSALSPKGEATGSDLLEAGITPGVIVTTAIINAVYEEVFVTGYVVAALRRWTSPWTPVLASGLLRASYHLYQGAGATLLILLLGLAFAYWYARNHRLLPLIAAHAVLDLYALTVHTNA